MEKHDESYSLKYFFREQVSCLIKKDWTLLCCNVNKINTIILKFKRCVSLPHDWTSEEITVTRVEKLERPQGFYWKKNKNNSYNSLYFFHNLTWLHFILNIKYKCKNTCFKKGSAIMVKRKTQLFNFLSVWQLLQSHQTLTLQQRQCSVFQAFVSCGLVGSKELSVVSSVTCGDMWREAPWSKCEEVLFLWSHLVLGLWSDFEEQRKNYQLHITWCNKHISSFYLNISFLMFSKDKVFSYHALFPVLHSTTQIRSMCEPVVG